jgi:phage shock protein PspC (stress-responsive transcriptional regulator)
MKHKLVSLFFATMALIGSAGTVFVYLLLSTVVCDSVDGSFLICSFVTWFFVFFCFFTIVVLPIYISIKTWK